ncbi:MAG: hypothetical protein LBG87_09895 [Spirochaetaceae bacterium]|jgi:histidinol dehydrogenase|nr:hypothetical protein [Spirochaetaceae bacterium]
MEIGSVENHRVREGGALVYPVYSRRSQGLSLGINVFPDRKRCSFNCPYCEVFPFETKIRFSLELMETTLRRELTRITAQGIAVKDICFSGNGEPTMAPEFPAALETVLRIRDASAPAASAVVITNGTGLLNKRLFDLLSCAADHGLKLWIKLDAGTESWYRVMNRSATPYQSLLDAAREFVSRSPATLQTMRCKVNGQAPSQEEREAWEKLVTELAGGSKVERVQLYGKARAAPEDPLAEPLSQETLEQYAQSLRKRLDQAGARTAVQVFP